MSTIAKFFVDKHWKSKLKLFLGFPLQTPATELTVVLFFFLFFFSLSLFLSLLSSSISRASRASNEYALRVHVHHEAWRR